ncbi:hypothetical protein DQ04_19811000 [Trypanosoma grayi]|uniref:hypothetical protein n=1 Tax=Trypanosoma grayi TaxID=71804 RepID=UPI0004F42609|nr:hypothetical protein DQ04_19811000 [Trypanosoma grayi]KEG05637.1 hypothetical protein DQ04_19811000 [Trypanosoma grayi]
MGSRAYHSHLKGVIALCVYTAKTARVMRRRDAFADALVNKASVVGNVLRNVRIKNTLERVASEANRADGISRGLSINRIEIATGWSLQKGAWELGERPFQGLFFSGASFV